MRAKPLNVKRRCPVCQRNMVVKFNPQREDWRRHPIDGGELKPIAFVEGYVVARRPRCAPFLMTQKNWRKLELLEK